MACGNNLCHISLLPIDDQEKIQLIRHGCTVYKFKLLRNKFLEELLNWHDENEIQLELEVVMNYLINMSDTECPEETDIATSLFLVHIKTLPWPLANIICFRGSLNTYYPSKLQFILSLAQEQEWKHPGSSCTPSVLRNSSTPLKNVPVLNDNDGFGHFNGFANIIPSDIYNTMTTSSEAIEGSQRKKLKVENRSSGSSSSAMFFGELQKSDLFFDKGMMPIPNENESLDNVEIQESNNKLDVHSICNDKQDPQQHIGKKTYEDSAKRGGIFSFIMRALWTPFRIFFPVSPQ